MYPALGGARKIEPPALRGMFYPWGVPGIPIPPRPCIPVRRLTGIQKILTNLLSCNQRRRPSHCAFFLQFNPHHPPAIRR